jgi:hypothetical protein
MKKIITGNWGGEPIWREETAEDRLRHELNQNKRIEKQGDLEDLAKDNFFDR